MVKPRCSRLPDGDVCVETSPNLRRPILRPMASFWCWRGALDSPYKSALAHVSCIIIVSAYWNKARDRHCIAMESVFEKVISVHVVEATTFPHIFTNALRLAEVLSIPTDLVINNIVVFEHKLLHAGLHRYGRRFESRFPLSGDDWLLGPS